jgi:hypothetical protein
MFKPEFLLLFQNPENGTPKHGLEGLCRFLDMIPARRMPRLRPNALLFQ